MKNNNRGSAIIEFVIIMPLFFLMLFGMLYGGIMLHDYNGLNELTRAAARAGAIEQTDDGNKAEEDNTESPTKKVAASKNSLPTMATTICCFMLLTLLWSMIP